MMFQLPPLKVNLPKPKHRKQEVVTEDGRRVKCLRRDTYLDMSQMALTAFPKMVLRCEDLETLIFNRNFLREMPRKISRLDCLELLDLSYNRFSEFPEEILAVTSLRELDLSHNNISSIPIDIRYLKFLKVLNLSNNRIKRLPNNLKNLLSLVCLNVSCNKLDEYPLALCSSFLHLQILKCSHNFIVELPYEIIMLPELCLKSDAVDFSHNPLTFPPIEVCNRGFEAMRNWIEPKWRNLKEFKRRKIMANTLKFTKTNMTRTSMWDKAPSVISSKASSTNLQKIQDTAGSKKSQKRSNETKADKTAQKTPKTSELAKSKGGKVVKTSKKKKTLSVGQLLKNDNLEILSGELDDSSRATLVEVYGDGSSPALHQLSPLPDSWTPAVTKTPGLDTPEGEAWSPAGEDRGYLSDGDGQESELLDLINQSFEPPDLNLPDSMLNMGSSGGGGGMLEHWLGTVQSMTMSDPTMTRDASCASTEFEGSSQIANAFTPFSDVKITKNSPEDSGGSEEEEEYDEEEEEDVSQSYREELLGVGDMSRHSISTPELDRLSVIFSEDDAKPSQQTGLKEEVRAKVKKPSKNMRRSSVMSAVSTISEANTITSTKGTKKKKRKKKKKKLTRQESELEIYSRIPYKPLLIAPRMVPTTRGLKTWAYFNEPKSCYLIDNMADISSSGKRVTFGSDEFMNSAPSTKSLLTDSCRANNSSNSSLDRSASVHSIESNQSQMLGASMSSYSQFSTPPSSPFAFDSQHSASPHTGPRDITSTSFSVAQGLWKKSSNLKKRPSSLPAPKQHTWTSEELQKFIFRPSDLMIPPKVLISYLKLDNEAFQANLILKLVNTLELNGLAECVCDLTTKEEYDFEELGYYDWLNEKVEECEFILVMISKHYVNSLSILTKLDGITPPHSASHRGSPYITAADINRWGLSPSEVQRRFIPVLNDDMEQIQTPSWIQQLPYFVPSEICELGYHLISRDCRESVMIPNIFETSQSSGLNTETAEESRADQLVLSMSDIG